MKFQYDSPPQIPFLSRDPESAVGQDATEPSKN